MLIKHESELDQYDIRRSPVGQWEVYDLSTGLVVVLNGSPLRGLYVGEAHQAAGLLNEEQARHARGKPQ
ncbi:hypothetical protein J2Y63_002912 [Shinella sp. BE166]